MARRSLHVIAPSPEGASRLADLEGTAMSLGEVALAQGYAPEVLAPNPTRAQFREALNRLTSGLDSGDSIWLTYGGHGLEGDGMPEDGRALLDQFLMLADGAFCDIDLMNVWLALPAGVNVLLLFDCCRAEDIVTDFVARLSRSERVLSRALMQLAFPTFTCQKSDGRSGDVKASVRYLASTGKSIERAPWLSAALLQVTRGGLPATFGELEAALRVVAVQDQVEAGLLRVGAFGASAADFRAQAPFL